MKKFVEKILELLKMKKIYFILLIFIMQKISLKLSKPRLHATLSRLKIQKIMMKIFKIYSKYLIFFPLDKHFYLQSLILMKMMMKKIMKAMKIMKKKMIMMKKNKMIKSILILFKKHLSNQSQMLCQIPKIILLFSHLIYLIKEKLYNILLKLLKLKYDLKFFFSNSYI